MERPHSQSRRDSIKGLALGHGLQPRLCSHTRAPATIISHALPTVTMPPAHKNTERVICLHIHIYTYIYIGFYRLYTCLLSIHASISFSFSLKKNLYTHTQIYIQVIMFSFCIPMGFLTSPWGAKIASAASYDPHRGVQHERSRTP